MLHSLARTSLLKAQCDGGVKPTVRWLSVKPWCGRPGMVRPRRLVFLEKLVR